MTHVERMSVINVFKELYKKGVMDKFTEIHNRFWVKSHKTREAIVWHRWFLNEMEKEMKKINPDVTLPYWVCLGRKI
jgi:tyrosinase